MSPKPLRKSVRQKLIRALHTGNEPLPSSAISDRINGSSEHIGRGMSPKQVAYSMNQLASAHPDVIEVTILGTNGTSHHGNARHRKAWSLKQGVTLADAERSVGVREKPKSETKTTNRTLEISLDSESMDFLRERSRLKNLKPGEVVGELISLVRENDLLD